MVMNGGKGVLRPGKVGESPIIWDNSQSRQIGEQIDNRLVFLGKGLPQDHKRLDRQAGSQPVDEINPDRPSGRNPGSSDRPPVEPEDCGGGAAPTSTGPIGKSYEDWNWWHPVAWLERSKARGGKRKKFLKQNYPGGPWHNLSRFFIGHIFSYVYGKLYKGKKNNNKGVCPPVGGTKMVFTKNTSLYEGKDRSTNAVLQVYEAWGKPVWALHVGFQRGGLRIKKGHE